MLMAKNRVDGVYDCRPDRDPDARKFDAADYMEALERRLQVMDSTALSLCMDNRLPIIVFDLTDQANLLRWSRATRWEHSYRSQTLATSRILGRYCR